eukprot:2831400-Rhodomonas_salina.2
MLIASRIPQNASSPQLVSRLLAQYITINPGSVGKEKVGTSILRGMDFDASFMGETIMLCVRRIILMFSRTETRRNSRKRERDAKRLCEEAELDVRAWFFVVARSREGRLTVELKGGSLLVSFPLSARDNRCSRPATLAVSVP